VELGIIGTGSMGGMLTRAWLSSGQAEHLHICNRTTAKADRLASEFPEKVRVHLTPAALAQAVDWIALCVKAEDARTLLPEIAPWMKRDGLLISTNSTLSLDELETTMACAAAKIIPSVTQSAGAGALLVMLGKRMQPPQIERLFTLLTAIGTPYEVAEKDLRIYSDMTSCGPAFLADWLYTWAQAAAKRGVPEEKALKLLGDMAYGVGKLCASGYTLADIIHRVAVPGGITSAGLSVLREAQEGVFDRLFETTAAHQRYINEHGHH